MLDLQHGSSFMENTHITASTDYKASVGSRLCIITAGVRQREGETRLDLLQRNTDILKGIVPQLIKYSPETILMIVSNPCDILSYVAWKLSGLPKNRVIGSGTNLDTSRFKFLVSQKLGVAPASVHGYIIGEHGDTSVPVWSGVNVAGVCLRDIDPHIGNNQDPEKWNEIHKQVVKSAYKVHKLKGYTSWAIASSCTSLAQTILRNQNTVHAVSTLIKGEHGVHNDVFLSLPCVLGSNGVTHIVRQHLTPDETKALQNSADLMHKLQTGLKF